MELRQLKTFQMVARLLSFNRAADYLNYAPSSVSSQIKCLEEELGQPLFDRLGKRIQLTQAGVMLMTYAQKMMDIEKETVARIAGWDEPHGSLSIRMPQSIGTYLLPSVLSQFQAGYPKVGLDIGTCAYDQLTDELGFGTVDIAFLLADTIPFSELIAEPLRIEPLVVVSSANHRLSGQTDIETSDLVEHPIFLPKHDCSYKMIFKQLLADKNNGAITVIELNSLEAIKQCVIQGLGVAMMPRMAIEKEVACQKLVILPFPKARWETAILMIRHKDKWLSPTLQAFMDSVREVMK